MSELRPGCAPKRTSADRSEFMNSRPTTPPDVAALIQGYDCFALATAPGWSVIGAAGGDAGVPERSNV